MKHIIYLFVFVFISKATIAQKNSSTYDPHFLFAPEKIPVNYGNTRTASGEPGTAYWQNNAHYDIRATLNDQLKTITATCEITYLNNSPSNLDFLWLQLDQQLFTKDSRGQKRMPVNRKSRYGSSTSSFNGGFKITEIKLVETDANTPASALPYFIYDTRMQIRLPKSIAATHGKIKFLIQYSFEIPEYGADRFGILQTENGPIFTIAQWYPRMCVYDDLKGWNTDPYLGPSEFYLEYGDYNVSITAPEYMTVAAGGELMNVQDVLNNKQRKRFEKAKTSDKTIEIIAENEIGNLGKSINSKASKTWKYSLKNARDFAWAASGAFIWDAAKIDLPSGKKSMAMSLYPRESKGQNAWGRSTAYVKGSVENYSKRWYEYPYPVAVNIASNVGGMEYPGIVFCSSGSTNAGLFGVTDHEFGHTWFPMIVGSNERRYGWMDEGFNTFINSLADDDFNNGEYNAPPTSATEMSWFLFNPDSEEIFNTPDAIREENIGSCLYYKPGLGLEILRNHILGEERFDYAFKTYIKRWAYKHPSPWDFFNTMENVSGENLNWFWKGWFIHALVLDQSIDSVEFIPNKGSKITIANNLTMAMPVFLDYTTTSGKKGSVKLPVEIWNNTSNFQFMIEETDSLLQVNIDPNGYFPDVERQNNVWKKGN